jgi:hypothetical protein
MKRKVRLPFLFKKVMKITLKMGLLFAFIWFAIKLIFHFGGWIKTDINPTILLNMLLLLLAISIGLYLHKKQEGFTAGNALSDIKAAMTAGIPYAILVSIFVYVYYAQINPEFVQQRISDAEMTIKMSLDDPEMFQKIKNEQEAFEVMTKEAIFEELKTGPANFYSAKSTAIIGLLGMTLLSTLYSIFVTIIYRRVLFRKL